MALRSRPCAVLIYQLMDGLTVAAPAYLSTRPLTPSSPTQPNTNTTMSSSSAADMPPHVVEDCRGVLQVLSDGTIIRSSAGSFFIPTPDDSAVEWKDVEYDAAHCLQLRLYRPRSPHTDKLPILYYFHGGGFCIGSRTWPNFHACCLRLAAELPAVVISPDYRLAPEHRLPAAIDDALSAVAWLSTTSDPWLSATADLTRVFIYGESAGGTITHHLAVRFGRTRAGPAPPVRVRGYILSMPAFGGTKRTRSEEESSDGAFLTMEMMERYWRLAMPVGATADHPVVSPFVEGAPSLEAAELGPMVVVIAGGDLLRDRDVEYARRLQGWGKPVELVEFPGQQHAFFSVDPWSGSADELVRVVKRFIEKN